MPHTNLLGFRRARTGTRQANIGINKYIEKVDSIGSFCKTVEQSLKLRQTLSGSEHEFGPLVPDFIGPNTRTSSEIPLASRNVGKVNAVRCRRLYHIFVLVRCMYIPQQVIPVRHVLFSKPLEIELHNASRCPPTVRTGDHKHSRREHSAVGHRCSRRLHTVAWFP